MHEDRTASTPVHRAARSGVSRLLVIYGPDASALGRVTTLGVEPVAVGRAGDIALGDAEVSRKHALFERSAEGGFWEVRDLGSHNGTFVNAARADRQGLVDGDVIRVGSTLLLFQSIKLDRDAPLAPETGLLWGASIAMQRVRGEVALVARQALPVLVLGESGTGKELVAREIHRQSGRTGPFVSVNCAALPANLVESELFGHVAGAFTGATRRSDGLFASSDGGTLLLDEIGEMPDEVQPKLLRALATGEIRAVGDTATRIVQTRVVAATNRDLRSDVEGGRFRGDLYARLAGWTIAVPPLRARREDVLPFAARFLERAGCTSAIGAHVAECLAVYDWPFNVRELEQTMAAVAVRGRSAVEIALEHLPPALRAPVEGRMPHSPSVPPPLALTIAAGATPSATELRVVLEHYGGNIAHAAAFFGRSRRQIYRWAEKYGIDLGAYRPE